MEQARVSLNPDNADGIFCESDFRQPVELTPEIKDEFIKINAMDIAVKFYDATDGLLPIEAEHYQSLFENGWAAQPVEEVVRIFGDWQTFQETVAKQRSEQLWARWREKQLILDEADKALEAGEVPDRLFKKVEPFISPEQPRKRVRKKGVTVENDSGAITDQDVPPDEKITRYCKYILAKEILTGTGKQPSEARLLGLALGIFLKDIDDNHGSLASSFNSEVKKASGEIVSQGAVEVKADSMGMFDYVYPEVRKKMLADIARDSGYQTDSPKQNTEILYDIATGNTIIGLGSKALESYLEQTQSYASDIMPIREALTRKDIDARFSESVVAYRYKDWTEGSYASYGKWLKSLIEVDAEVTARLLRRANHLGLGPSPEQIANRFDGSLSNFYDNADLTKKNIKNQFDDWTYDDFIDHLRRVHEETGQRLSVRMLKERIKKGKIEPSPDLMKHKFGSRNKMFAEAGSKPFNQPISREDCFAIGVEFFRRTGRLIEPSDVENDPDLPSRFPFQKHFDGFENYKKELAEKLEQLDYEAEDTEELAA